MADANQPNPELLAQHLVHETGLVRDFISILEDENRVLATPAVGNALDETTARKNQHIAVMEQAAAVRSHLLAALGFTSPPNELGAVVLQYPMLRDSANALADAAAQANKLNCENGGIIDAYQQHTQEAMAMLQSLVGAQENRLYDASGRTKAARPQNTGSPTTRIKAG